MTNKIAAYDQFVNRHIGISEEELKEMLKTIGVDSLDQLIDETVPSGIRLNKELDLPEAITEFEYFKMLKGIANQNKVFRSYIGQGFNGTITPSVILRNVFQNPGWYTQYTPYQAEIAQGRLEALLNFQTMVSDLTGLTIANASLLDEGTAVSEAVHMFYALKNKRNKGDAINEIFVDKGVYEHTIDVLRTRCEPLDIKIIHGDWESFEPIDRTFGVVLQYPNMEGEVEDYRAFAEKMKSQDIYITVAADILSLALLMPPGEWGADAVVGNTQRFGVPMGYGGPHAAYFATREDFKRNIPGRIIGVSQDRHEDQAYRMALQTREQHIRREKATSNICTAQALLAVMAGMYGVYHGPRGIKAIAERVHQLTRVLAQNLKDVKITLATDHFFDTISIPCDEATKEKVRKTALEHEINFWYTDKGIQIALDETVLMEDIDEICSIFAKATGYESFETEVKANHDYAFPEGLVRTSEYMTHPVFKSHHTETKMMRYLKSLENKDLSLVHSMISLGSCTMKLNAAVELEPISWPEFANIHPFVPLDQTEGYQQIFKELERDLSEITGFEACSLQPNSGAQGEFTGLLTIRAYHIANGNRHRNITLVPSSAHGTNPASSVMAGMNVIVIKTDDHGNIDIDDLREKAEANKEHLGALMITYPSTHGVFETHIKEVCDIIHENGGLVYMDGANMNAQVGLTTPGAIHADVCHLNLHKTFAIPHGGGGPGMGPICVNSKLAPFLPKHHFVETGGEQGVPAVASAPWGSASILLISYGYIKMLGKTGLRKATEYAILNSNYIKSRLEDHYQILYSGENGRAAHEFIVDLRQFKSLGISAEDIAKRLMDYSFHAPTLSFPVPGTVMIEPTESEDKDELDRFCDALIQIRKEIDEIATGEADKDDNVLHNAPHTMQEVASDDWNHAYSREKAAYALPFLRSRSKFWPAVARVDNAYGDRHLVCTCPPIEYYMAEER